MPPPPPPVQPHTPVHEPEEISNEIPEDKREHTEYHESSEVTNKIAETSHQEPPVVTELPTVVEPTQDPYTPRVLDNNCGSDNGGCDQICERVLFPGENEPRIKCSCSQGFSLDPYDYSTCHGKLIEFKF